jgi:copper chaperone CopZ
VQSALSKVPGVIKAEVTMPDKAVVTVDKKKVKSDQLIKAVKKAGYSAKEKKEKPKA